MGIAQHMNPASTLTDQEYHFLTHVQRWGSDGYPIARFGSRWRWVDSYGIRPEGNHIFATKRDAMNAIESFLDHLRDKHAGRAA